MPDADQINTALKIGLLTVVTFIVVALLRRRFSFRIQIENGRLLVTHGVLPARLRDEMQTALTDAGVTTGWIGGRRRGRLTLLDFSTNVPPDVQQRLRNVVNFVK